MSVYLRSWRDTPTRLHYVVEQWRFMRPMTEASREVRTGLPCRSSTTSPLRAGNANGDLPMLDFAADAALQFAAERGYTVVSVTDYWTQVFRTET